jgi:hypothetical protein
MTMRLHVHVILQVALGALMLLPQGESFCSSLPVGHLRQGLGSHYGGRGPVATLHGGKRLLGGFGFPLGSGPTMGRRSGGGMLGKLSGSLNDAITKGLVTEATTLEDFEEIKNSQLAVVALSATTCRKVRLSTRGSVDGCMVASPKSARAPSYIDWLPETFARFDEGRACGRPSHHFSKYDSFFYKKRASGPILHPGCWMVMHQHHVLSSWLTRPPAPLQCLAVSGKFASIAKTVRPSPSARKHLIEPQHSQQARQ